MEYAYGAIVGGLGASVGIGWWIKKTYDNMKLRNIIRSVESEGWTHIGKVNFVCIYPIDGGCGKRSNSANFGRYGLQSLPDPNDSSQRITYDRCYVVYTAAEEPHRVIFNHSAICRRNDKYAKVENLWHTLKLVASTFSLSSRVELIQYLGRNLRVQIAGEQIKNQLKIAYGIPLETELEVGYISPLKRIEFNEVRRREYELYGNPNCHLSNYSSCTMVNTKSIRDLKKKSRRIDLTYKNFRPHIVFEGNAPYIEENVCAIKIGDLEFLNVRPCTHSESINLDYRQLQPADVSLNRAVFEGNCEEVPEDPINLAEYLSQHRPLSRTGSIAYQNSTEPVFGINLHFEMPQRPATPEEDEEEDEDAILMADEPQATGPAFYTICKGEQIYAKYNLPRDHPQAVAEDIL